MCLKWQKPHIIQQEQIVEAILKNCFLMYIVVMIINRIRNHEFSETQGRVA